MTVLERPAGETTAPPPRAPKSPFLNGLVAPVAVPVGYRLNLVAVAFAMVLLPIFYLGVVAAAAAGTLLYIAYVWPQLAGVHNWQVNLIVGGGPPIAGIVLVGYMLRSMIPRRRGAHGGIILAYAAAPALHDLVQEIAAAIGAPRPREIRVDLEANASAALRKGAWSLFRRDLVLTVGLPLAAGLDSRQLAGVIAHELGHFAQRGGMGVTYVIRSINNWFARVVYERGRFDSELETHAEGGYYLKRFIAQIARFFIWLSRKILWLLMQAGAALSASLSRQMELDADRYSARVVGARVTAATLAEIPRLDAAARAAWSEVNWHWREGRLTSDLPGRVADLRQSFRTETLNEIDGQNRRAKRAWHSTHPSHAERRKSLLPEPPEGVYQDESPARELFADFDRLCRTASVAEYKAALGEKFDEAELVERDQIRRTHAQVAAEGEAFVRMFGAVLSRSRELPLGIFEREVLPEEARAAAERALPALAAEALAAQAAMETANKRYAELEQLGDDLEALVALRDAEVPQAQWGPAEEIARVIRGAGEVEGAPGLAESVLTAALANATAEQQRLREELRASDERAGRRLTLAMAASPEATKKSEAAALAAAFGILDQTLPVLREVRRGALALHALWSRLEANRKSTRFGKELEDRYAALHANLTRLFAGLADRANPLSTHERSATLQKAIVPELPPIEAAWPTLQVADAAVERWVELRIRMMMRLAALAEASEGAEGAQAPR